MKKMAVVLAVLMLVGASAGWCVTPAADGFVDTHTKNSSLRPVQDTGKVYGTINHHVGTSMNKVPVLKSRSVVVEPVEKLGKESVHASKSVINGVWDILTFRSMREKK